MPSTADTYTLTLLLEGLCGPGGLRALRSDALLPAPGRLALGGPGRGLYGAATLGGPPLSPLRLFARAGEREEEEATRPAEGLQARESHKPLMGQTHTLPVPLACRHSSSPPL